MADIRDCVRSLLPGRARLRHPMLHGLEAESCRDVAGMLETIPGVTGVSINPRVGSPPHHLERGRDDGRDAA